MVKKEPTVRSALAGAYWKDFFRGIWKTRNRFLSILLISALGVAFYAGIRAASPDMRLTVDRYYKDQRMMDVGIISTMGLTQADVDAVEQIPGVKQVMPVRSADMILTLPDREWVVRVKAMPVEGGLNLPLLLEGRLPVAANEAAVNRNFLKLSGQKLGSEITLRSGGDDPTEDTLKNDTFTIVGVVDSPEVLTYNLGSSNIGSGTVDAMITVPMEAFSLKVYTEILLLAEDADTVSAFSKRYTQLTDALAEELKAIAPLRAQARYDEVVSDARSELDDAKRKLSDAEEERRVALADAEAELEDARQKLLDGERELVDNEQKFIDEIAKAEKKLADARRQIEDGQRQLDEQTKTLEEGEAALAAGEADYQAQLAPIQDARKKVTDARAQWQKGQDEWVAGQEQLGALNEQIAALEKVPETPAEELATLKTQAQQLQAQLTQSKETLNASLAEIEKNEKELTAGEQQLSAARATLDATALQLEQGRAQLLQAQTTLDEGRQSLQNGEKELATQRTEGEQKLKDARQELEQGRKDYEQGVRDYERERSESAQKIADARIDIRKGEEELAKVKLPEWFVQTRKDNVSFANYRDDTDRVTAIGRVFPLIFFLVAIFVTLTTMTRMVEEDRAKIGTYKALGYSDTSIAAKYLYYAFFACLIGSGLGLSVGLVLFPRLIAGAYGLIYISTPPVQTPFNFYQASGATAAAILSTTFSALLACRASTRRYPARLLRPKSPRPGKRILLERIGFIWKRLSFTQKVTFRNLFRYKKRFLMTIAGIGGCTALLLTGFGLKDSISSIATLQFQEIWKYDLQAGVRLGEGNSAERIEIENFLSMGGEGAILSSLFVQQTSVDVEKDGQVHSANLFVPKDASMLSEMVTLRTRVGHHPIALTPGQGAVITEKLSSLMNLNPGDTLTFTNGDHQKVQVQIAAVTENYPSHYIYLAPQDYTALYDKAVEPNVLLARLADTSAQAQDQLGRKMLTMDGILRLVFTRSTLEQFNDLYKSLDAIVWVLIFSAAALAFVVTYILTNINIAERQRELATLKVLGFTESEVAASVYRENVLLTLIGTAVGLIAGIWLHRFVMGTAEQDALMFGRNIQPISYLFSGVLTVFFSGLVNIVMRRNLANIDMVESLKSVE